MIPVCEPFLGEDELRYVTDCIRSNWISSKGYYIYEFENRFAKYCEAEFGITTTNGTAALHLALASAGIRKGDEIIMPAFTMMSTALAAVYCGARPVFVDAEPDTWNMKVDDIEDKITDQTAAIMPVHIYGHPCDMKPIMDAAEDRNILVIEDAAEAHGALYKGKKVGGIGDIGCFSFYANKIITCGEGGMIVTSDPKIRDRANSLKDLAFNKDRRFIHEEIGFNYRMTNIQAAIGLAQFEKIEEYIALRRQHAALYTKLLGDIGGLQLPVERPWARNVYWMYALLVTDGFNMGRDDLVAALAKEGIETRPFFIPMNRQPALLLKGVITPGKFLSPGEFPVAERIGNQGLYLPSGTGLENDDIIHICDKIHRIWNRL